MNTEEISEADIFASASEPAQPELPAQQPERALAQEQPTPNLGQIPSEGEEEGTPEPAPTAEPVRVPIAEVQAQRERRRKAEADLAARDRELAEMRGQMAAIQQMMQRQAQPQAQPEAPKVFDPFAQPEEFTDHRASQVVRQQLDPVVQAQQRMMEVQTFNNRLIAENIYTKDAVKAAEDAFNSLARSGQIDRNEYDRINKSPNPFAAAVDWHRRNEVLSKVGNDPDKWFQTQFEQRLSSDPEFQKQVYDRLQGQAQAAVASPSGRAAPLIVPPSLNAASGASARQNTGTITEADIFASAPSRMGGRT